MCVMGYLSLIRNSNYREMSVFLLPRVALSNDFDCPHCGYSTGVFISVGASGVGYLDGSWETDQTCPVCDEDVIVECH